MFSAFPKVTDAVAPDAVTDLQPVPPGSVLFHPVGRGVDSQTVYAPVDTGVKVATPDALVDALCNVVAPDFRSNEKDCAGAPSVAAFDTLALASSYLLTEIVVHPVEIAVVSCEGFASVCVCSRKGSPLRELPVKAAPVQVIDPPNIPRWEQ